jgi:hypothetical protein
VTSISYVDTNGTTQTWSAALYQTDLPSGRKRRARESSRPMRSTTRSTRGVYNAVTVRFVAGTRPRRPCPFGLKAAIKMLVAHWYARREPVNIGNLVTPIPLTIDSLLWPYKSF